MENKNNNIANEIDTSRKKQVIENRSILRPIIETLIVCGKQNIAKEVIMTVGIYMMKV